MKDLKKSTAAGFILGVSATIYLSCTSKILGSFLFAIGLFVICTFNLNLFTGKIGYVLENKKYLKYLKMWFGNLIGCMMSVIPIRISKPELSEVAYAMVQNKLSYNFLSVIILSFFCGVLMYIAVENYKQDSGMGKQLGLFLCVVTFILCGFEHSIANMCYFIFAINSMGMCLKALTFVIVVSIFNGVGAVLCRWLLDEK